MARSLPYRVFLLVIDQLAGHWVEGVKVYENFPPANVEGYHQLDLIPNFSALINEGLWIRRPWNRGVCDTPHGMKYLATGSYKRGGYWIFNYENSGMGYYPEPKIEDKGLFEVAQRQYGGRIKIAVFTTDCWTHKGYFYVPTNNMHALPGSYPDELMWRDFALPWLEKNQDWDVIHMYFPVNDKVSFCPSYNVPPLRDSFPTSSKHAYLLYLDQLVGEIVNYLKFKQYWNETYMIIASDHGYHLGCSTAKKFGATSVNQCLDHPAPHDCVVWDFENNKPTNIRSDCTRRITFIVSGGALSEKNRKKVIDEAEIIDVAPTIADILGVDYECEGKSVLR